MPKNACFIIVALAAVFVGCSSTPARKTIVFQTGEKAPVDKLTYSVVDTQILTHLGDEPNVRTPQTRFYVVQISVSNGGNEDVSIPAMTLVDDSGKTYDELPDGSGVSRWLGVVRHVGPNQSEAGNLVFDAPASHYKLKLTDDTDANDVFVDIPLSFAHEQVSQGAEATSEAVLPPAEPAAAAANTSAAGAKKK
jgi:hypothetical protein